MKKAFSTIEYILLVIVIASSFIMMMRFFRMFLMGRQKEAIEAVWEKPKSDNLHIHKNPDTLDVRRVY